MAHAPDSFAFMMASLQDVQDSVKSYDTKSQIVGVGYIFAVNVIFSVGAKISSPLEIGLVGVLVAWAVIIMPIILFGMVLYPTRRFAPKLGERGSSANRIFYSRMDRVKDVDDYLAQLDASDIRTEIAYEILKMSGLRDRKHTRFIRGLFAAGFSFVVLFLGQILRVVGLSPL